jgi:nicotinate-nucleotide adenylyltransferase
LIKVNKKKNTKLGILGGSFDPPHKGHVYISKTALTKLKLDKLIWVVTKKNPYKKKPYLNTKIRIKLSKNLVKNEKKNLSTIFRQ